MTSPVITSFSQVFSGATDGGLELINFVYPVGLGAVALRLADGTFTDGPPVLYASTGTVNYFGTTTETIAPSFETIQGATSLTVWPGQTATFVFSLDGDGNPFSPVITVASPRKLVFDKPVFGLIKKGGYSRVVYVLRYQPSVSGSLYTYGTVAAVKLSKMALVDVVPPTNEDQQYVEVFKVVSKTIVNDQGEWEYPNGWPSAPSYPGIPATQTPEADSGVVVNRTHEICRMNSSLSFVTQTSPARIKQPFATDFSYKPKIFMQPNTAGLSPEQKSKAADIVAARLRAGFSYGII